MAFRNRARPFRRCRVRGDPAVPPIPGAPSTDITSADPLASIAIWRKVVMVASLVMYILTPRDETTAGRLALNPDSLSWAHKDTPAAKLTGTKRNQSGMP